MEHFPRTLFETEWQESSQSSYILMTPENYDTSTSSEVVVDINDINNLGNTVAEFNAYPASVLQGFTDAQKVRFSYGLSKTSYSDIAKVNRLSMKADLFGYLVEYKGAEVRLRNGYSEVVVPEIGTYVVTYL